MILTGSILAVIALSFAIAHQARASDADMQMKEAQYWLDRAEATIAARERAQLLDIQRAQMKIDQRRLLLETQKYIYDRKGEIKQ